MAGSKASSSAAVSGSRRFSTSNSATIWRCDAASWFRCLFRLIEIVLIDLMLWVCLLISCAAKLAKQDLSSESPAKEDVARGFQQHAERLADGGELFVTFEFKGKFIRALVVRKKLLQTENLRGECVKRHIAGMIVQKKPQAPRPIRRWV